jgi:hypothetical protein
VPVPVLALPRWNSFPVRALAKCPYQYWHCRDGVHFPYGHLPSAHTGIGTATMEFISSTDTLPSARTSIGTAAMEFISSTGTCQVPVPVLALPRWSSFPVLALAKCLYQYWHGYSLPKLVNSIVLWKNCNKKENTSEFESDTSTGIALPRTGIGNLRAWVPSYIFRFRPI